jgi:hypothetical protein
MSEINVNVVLKATDEASKTVAEAGKQITESMRQVEEANKAVTAEQEKTNASVRSLVTGFSGLATGAFALYNAYDRVADMQVSVDRANLQVKTSLNALEDAQRRYNAAVEKYGVDSEQARAAAADLTVAQERYQVAVERANMIQGNLNEAMVQSALTVIPTVITMVDSGVKVFQNFHGAVNLVNSATAFLAANPLMAVVMAIGLVVGALITAYQTCEPFRNAINAIGQAIYNFFKPAIDAVVGALTWLWQNVVQPFIGVLKTLWDVITGNPILAALFGPITTIAYLIQHWSDVTKALGDVWNAICSGVSWAWNTFVKPIVDAVKWFCDTVYGAFKALFGWLVGGSVWTDLCKGIVSVWNTVVAPLIGTVKDFCNTIGGFFSGLADTAGKIWNSIVNTVSGAVNTIKNAAGGIASAVGNAVNSAGNALNNFASNVGGAMSDAWNSISSFIGKVCFAHAIENAVESSRKSLSVFNDAVEEAMNTAYGTIKSFGAELKAPALGPNPAAVGSTPAGSQTLVLAPTFNFPEGSIAPQDPREFAEAVYNELSAIVRRDLRAQTFFVAR